MHAHRLPRVAGLLLALTILAFFGLHTGDAFAAGGHAATAEAEAQRLLDQAKEQGLAS